jgi:hypothetical protein
MRKIMLTGGVCLTVGSLMALAIGPPVWSAGTDNVARIDQAEASAIVGGSQGMDYTYISCTGGVGCDQRGYSPVPESIGDHWAKTLKSCGGSCDPLTIRMPANE